MAADRPTHIDLTQYFTSDQLKLMSSYERTRNENLIRNYEYMKSIGLQLTLPKIMANPVKTGGTVNSKPAGDGSNNKSREQKQTVTPEKSSASERKQVKRFTPPPVKFQIEKQECASNTEKTRTGGFNDSFEDFANRIQFDGTLAAVHDDDYDPRDFEWSFDEKGSGKANLSEGEVRPATKRRKGVQRAMSARRSSPFKFGHNNIKMLFHHEKMLPRRKCAASVQSYEEDDVETDDSFIYCEECKLECVDNCLIHPLVPIYDTQIPVGYEDRARKTLPTGLSLSNSKIKNAGKGVWTDVKIPQFTRFGPYEGVKQPVKDIKLDEVSGYGWLITDKTDRFYIDGEDVKQSNWLRF